jgi:hypothetical protein
MSRIELIGACLRLAHYITIDLHRRTAVLPNSEIMVRRRAMNAAHRRSAEPSIGNAKTLPYLTLCTPFFDDAPNTPNKVGGNEDYPQIDCAKRHIGHFHRCRSLTHSGRKKRPATGGVLTPNIEAAVLFRPIRCLSQAARVPRGLVPVILVVARPFRLKNCLFVGISRW